MDGMAWLNGLFPSACGKGRVAENLDIEKVDQWEAIIMKQEKAPSQVMDQWPF